MSNIMEYRGYVGSVEFSQEDSLFFGRVQGIRSLISYEGSNATELVDDFHAAVDDYLAMCDAEGISPERAYKGSFNVRIDPQLHRQLAIRAHAQHTSLNSIIESALRQYLSAGR